MDHKYSLTINHMYSKALNIYGDLGNIKALRYRSESRLMDIKLVNTEINTPMNEADIYFIGGGQDIDQLLVYKDLLKHKEFITSEVEKGKVFLLICGGYQLFGNYFIDGKGNQIEGLSILDIDTKALDYNVASRCIGNIVVEMNQDFLEEWEVNTNFSKYIVGFENHGGQTKIMGGNVLPLGSVIKGYGNNSFDKIEGAFNKGVIGSYCHGSLLPKNPHLTDAILRRALKNKYDTFMWQTLEYEEEKKAHEHILKLAKI